MKLDKKLFKSIVKECLVEILAEGLYPHLEESKDKKLELRESVRMSSSTQRRSPAGLGKLNTTQQQNLKKRNSYLDKVSFNSSTSETNSTEIAKKLVSNVTKDPIMSAIFSDTAMTTLQEQREGRGAPSSKPADEAARIVAGTDPLDLFGESAGKWADLAFAPPIGQK